MSSSTHHSVILGPSLCHRLVLLYFWIRKQSLSLSVHSQPRFIYTHNTHPQHILNIINQHILHASFHTLTFCATLSYKIRIHMLHTNNHTHARTHTMKPYKKLKKFLLLHVKRNKSFTHTYFTGGLLILLIYSIKAHLYALHTIILYIYISY